MISKVLYSKSIANTLNYVMNPEKDAEVVLSEGIGSLSDVQRIIQDFERQASLHPTLQVKLVHIPISFHPDDLKTLDAHATEILQDWIDHLDLHCYRMDQYAIVRHHDKDDKNPHFHLVGNVVLNDGSRMNLANIGAACREASISITEKWGLTSAKHAKIEKEQSHESSIACHSSEIVSTMNATTFSSAKGQSRFGDDGSGIPIPYIELESVDVKGMAQEILFPQLIPATPSGGGGSGRKKKDDEEDDKNKRKTKKGGFRR